MALVANCHRSKGRAYYPEDFHPCPNEEPELTDEELDKALGKWLGA